jgi:hypothetical protein
MFLFNLSKVIFLFVLNQKKYFNLKFNWNSKSSFQIFYKPNLIFIFFLLTLSVRGQDCTMENNYNTCQGVEAVAMWLNNVPGYSSSGVNFVVSGGSFIENRTNGTATMSGTMTHANVPSVSYSISVSFSGGTYSQSPHSGCYTVSGSGYYYYTSFSGTLTSTGSTQVQNISFGRKGPAFQVGYGASLWTANAHGAAGWIMGTSSGGVSVEGDIGPVLSCTIPDPCTASLLASNSGPSCTGGVTQLTATPSGASGNPTFSWVGPNGFTSNLQNPVTTSGPGTYMVTMQYLNNTCSESATTVVKSSALYGHISTEVNLVKSRTINDETGCLSSTTSKVLTISSLMNLFGSGAYNNWRILNTSTIKEYCDGTALISMQVQNLGNTNYTMDINVILSGRVFTPPFGSPRKGFCNFNVATTDWYYYTQMQGSLIGTNGLAGGNVCIEDTGSAFQLGTNASTNDDIGLFGANGRFIYTIISNPTAKNFTAGGTGEFMFGASGNTMTQVESSTCGNVCFDQPIVLVAKATCGKPNYTYTWSNGLGTGQSKTVTPMGTATYTVTITDNNNCTAVDMVMVTTNPQLNFTISNDEVCLGGNYTKTVQATGGTPGYTYNWSNGLGTGSQKSIPTSNATYTVTVTDNKGCTAVGSFTVTVGTLSAGASNDGPLTCTKTSVTLTATGGGTYAWSGGGTGATKVVTTAGTYTVTVTNTANGCTATASTVVTGNTTAPSAGASNDGPLTCTKTSVTLTATGGGTYAWSGGGTGATKVVTTAGTYTVTVTNTTNGCTATASTVVSGDTSIPSAGVSNDGPLTCTKTSVTLTATGGGTYAWSGGGTGATKVITTAGTYTVTVTNTTNGCTATASTVVSGDTSIPSAGASNDGPLMCTKTSVTLTATGGGTYAWSGGGTGATKVVTTAGTYTVTVTNTANGCTATASTVVTGNTTAPSAGASNDGPLTCTKTSVTLTATGGGTYAWSGGGTGATKVVTTAGTYTVTVTNTANGCTATASTVVTGNTTVPSAGASNDGPLTCTKTSVTLTATGSSGVSYLWSGGGTNPTKVVSTIGTYTVTVTSANGCTASSMTTVTQNIVPPSALASNDGPLTCSKTSVLLTANPATGVTYVWSNGGQTTRQKTVTLPGTYSVTITDNLNGCTAVATTTVNQNTVVPNASAENLGGPLTCIDNSVTIQAFPNDATYTYNWNGPSGYSSTSRTNTVGIAGTYTVTVTNTVSNCTSTATTTVTQNVTLPTVTVNNDGPLTCSKTSVTMTALPGTGLTYSWSGGGTGQTKVVTVAGTYTVTVTDIVNGCTAVNSTTVAQNTTVTPATASNDGPLTCSKTSVTLTATPTTGVSYAWSGGGTSQSKVVTVPGLYTLTVTTISNGCTSTATTNVTQDIIAPIASADNIGGPLTCTDNSVTVRAFPNIATYSYEWSGPNSYYGTSRTQDVSVSGNYVVTVTNTINGCKSSASTAVLQDVGIPTANAGGNKTICNGTSTTLTATGNGSYLWSNNMTTASITVTPVTTTTYTITVTGSNGCTNTASALVTVTPLPASGLTGPTEVCMDEYGVFSASPAVSGATYSWTFDGGTSLDGDANDPTESVKWAPSYANTTRTVTLVVTKDNCSSTYTKAVIVKQGAYLNTQALYPVCQGGTVQIGPNPNDPAQVTPGSSFQWTPNLFLNNNTVARPLSTPPFDIAIYVDSNRKWMCDKHANNSGCKCKSESNSRCRSRQSDMFE